MTQLTIEATVKLDIMVHDILSTAARIDDKRIKISKMERDYDLLCKGFPKGKEPLRPVELIDLHLEVQQLVRQYDDLGKQLNALEDATREKLTVKVISQGKNGAMVVLQGDDEISGKRVSVTRHLRKSAGKFTGKSLFGHRTVEYALPAPEMAVAA